MLQERDQRIIGDPTPRRKPARRARKLASASLSFALMAALVALGFGAMTLALGRINLDMVKPMLVAALQDRLGAGLHLAIEGVGVERAPHGLALAVEGVTITRADGRRLLSAPRAEIVFDPFSLLAGRLKPSKVTLDRLTLALLVGPDGGLTLSAGGEAAPAASPPNAGQEAGQAAGREAAPAGGPASAPAGRTDGLDGGEKAINPPSVAAPTSAPDAAPRAKALRQAAGAINMIFQIAAGSDSPLAELDHFDIRDGALIVDDRVVGRKQGFDDFSFALDRSKQHGRGVAQLEISARGPSGRWRLSGRATGASAENHELAIEGENFSIDEVALALGATRLPIDSDIPIAFKTEAAFQGDGHVLSANARLNLGQGFWRFDDPDFPPVLLDEFFAALHWDGAAHRAAIDEIQLFSRDSRCFLTGAITPPPHDPMPWTLQLRQLEPCVIGPERPQEKAVTLNAIRGDFSVDVAQKLFSIDRLELVGPEVGAAVTGGIDVAHGVHMRIGASAANMTASGALAIWPNAFGAPARAWLGDHLLSGKLDHFRLTVDLDDLDLRMMRAQHPPMNDRVSLDYGFSDLAFTFLNGAPPVMGVSASGHSAGRSTRVEASTGYMEGAQGRRIDLWGGVLAMPDLSRKPAPLAISAHGRGGLDTLGEILSAPGFARVASLPLDPKTTRGQFEGEFTFRTALQEVYDRAAESIEVGAKVENFSADHLVGKANFEQGSLAVSLLGGVTHVTGSGKIFGAPASLEFSRSDSQPPKGTISFAMDEAARAKAGLPFGATVTGPIAVRIVGDVGAASPSAAVDLDLVKAGLNYPIAGLFKPAGRPAKASFTYREDERGGASLDDFNYDGVGQSARGALTLGPDGGLSGARLSEVKFSPGDNLKIDVERSGETLNIAARGAALDARPFLRDLSGSSGRGGAASDIDLDLQTTLLTGANRQIISNAALRFARKRNGGFSALSLSGKLGGDQVKGVLSRPDDGAPLFSLSTSDGGALLAFFDFYDHMEGGALNAKFRLLDGGFSGAIDIDNFVLRGEPALKSFARAPDAEQLTSRIKLDPNVVSFSRLHAQLDKSNGVLTIRDGVIANPSIGSTIDGTMDFDRETLDLSGTFVPAYGVNNLFGQLPVIGMVLGGGAQEGLFGISFRVSGKTSDPKLSVNPLSAIAPGFLRKIFGILP